MTAGWDAELTELVTHRGGALVSHAYMLVGDRREAEDLVQDALVKVYSKFRRPRQAGTGGMATLDVGSPVENVEGYVRRTIMTLFLDGYRRRRRWFGVHHLLAADASVRGADVPAAARADVRAALKQLTPRRRACVVLRYYEDLTVPQIAAELGVTEGTVKRHLHAAMPVLRELLGSGGGPDGETGPGRATAPGTRRISTISTNAALEGGSAR
ncbi:SigE family RNA polymerase sigma factor [Myceligenerans pegani]|uniref:SigE family RNA polymerase sigma factor n=1 Tax=Myceligenerans pegani TaxID=2776917 RepID=A0ABR9MWI0_9MICO|nr:SigE family RNA polymerase sigma factor [Myceligenerans sp. TRM 65318]MBE1875743.1 SigE family RNA polymerase sigma factor [Myceligenerans sp. TRM 65318]MBE3018014.1 SigE family RNA polymerase sigma factor [Myceligenerans sp. TRM 65318]